MRWDIFCKVVDNFGDAGVAWRLARMLADEHALDVTLWIDALAPLARIAPRLQVDKSSQRVDSVQVRALDEATAGFVPADVVVEAFAGGLPERYVDAMATRTSPPRWFRLEYLSLDPSLDAHHGLPSPHPRLPLARTFWIPGLSARTGGLMRERDLFAERDVFARDIEAQQAFLASLGVPARARDELRVSMFCYAHAPLDALLAAWSRAGTPISCLVPERTADEAIARFLRAPPPKPGDPPALRGALRLYTIPFVDQRAFDRVLWSCDVNFVRGEDSFVRAQWAAKPFVWNAYAQAESAHAGKIAAFIDRYASEQPTATATAVRALYLAWNALPDAPPIAAAWSAYVAHVAALRSFGDRWSATLAMLPELATGLVSAAKNAL